MGRILEVLDREWDELATSPKARRALIRWANVCPVLAGFRTLEEVVASRHDPARSEPTQRALALLAAEDDVAARTLLKAVTPGLVTIAARFGNDDEAAIEEVMALAWERIRTYPCHRSGTVAANVLLDVRKRYRRHRTIETPESVYLDFDLVDSNPSVEEEVLGRLFITDLVESQCRGLMTKPVLATILRTRVGGEALAEVANEQQVSVRLLRHRRWRAEVRLRQLPLAA